MKILVIGDSCKDVFVYGICERICPEAPVPVFSPKGSKSNFGMAYNVFNNLKALGVDELGIVTNENDQPIKIRFVDSTSNQMVLRVDENDNVKRIDFDTLSSIKFSNYHAVVISDYNKGYLNESDIEFIASECRVNNVPTFLDTKKQVGGWISNIQYLKINKKEFEENKNGLTNYYKNNIIITLGGSGALFGRNGMVRSDDFVHVDKTVEFRDLSGAGDTFLAAFVYDILLNDSMKQAVEFANKCASWVVSQRGVVSVDKTKI